MFSRQIVSIVTLIFLIAPRRRSRNKPLSSTFQPSLTRLTEEGSSLSSSTASSCLSLQLAESTHPKGHHATAFKSEEYLDFDLLNETSKYGINLSNVSSAPVESFESVEPSNCPRPCPTSGIPNPPSSAAVNPLDTNFLMDSPMHPTDHKPTEVGGISSNVSAVSFRFFVKITICIL